MPPLFDQFANWLAATDQHAPHRLATLADAEKVLAGREAAGVERRLSLAAALERWRYQHLNERVLHRADRGSGQALADALDQAANELAARPPRPPRNPRAAIGDELFSTDAVSQALACLDPTVPLAEVERRAQQCTEAHFAARTSDGTSRRRVLLYAPLYLSSHCINYCTYCGFRFPLDIHRRHLSVEAALGQVELLRRRGFRHILLVAGDFPRLTTTDYFLNVLRSLNGSDVRPALEIAPQTTQSYAELAAAGACGLTLYQETYDPELYAHYHPRGTKASFDWRLEGAERAAEAGFSRLGLGVLLGLADPRRDLAALIRHAAYLHARFPETALAFSLPRIHEAAPGFKIPYPVDDDLFRRLYCGLRMAFPGADLVLSTREAPELRNGLARVCITQMSAGSSTSPGGYDEGPRTCGADDHCGQAELYDGQFPVHDERPSAEVYAWLEQAGLQPVWTLAGTQP